MKSITIQNKTWQKLTILKAELLAQSMDEVINELIKCQKAKKQLNAR